MLKDVHPVQNHIFLFYSIIICRKHQPVMPATVTAVAIAWSVCLSVCHTRELCWSHWMQCDAICHRLTVPMGRGQ